MSCTLDQLVVLLAEIPVSDLRTAFAQSKGCNRLCQTDLCNGEFQVDDRIAPAYPIEQKSGTDSVSF